MSFAALFERYGLTEDLAFHRPYRDGLEQLTLAECEAFLKRLPKDADLTDDAGRAAFNKALFGLQDVTPAKVDAEAFATARSARPGRTNPEPFLPDFWHAQIVSCASGHAANRLINTQAVPGTPVWSFQRFGASYTPLRDGRWVAIAGEHEDHYDEDFQIYSDVTVFDGRGGIEHFIYPDEDFPATDFHSATLAGDRIWIVGSLGYQSARQPNETQVLQLDLTDFSISRSVTTGDNPGWINRHEATLDGEDLILSGGYTEPGWRQNAHFFALNLTSLNWRRI